MVVGRDSRDCYLGGLCASPGPFPGIKRGQETQVETTGSGACAVSYRGLTPPLLARPEAVRAVHTGVGDGEKRRIPGQSLAVGICRSRQVRQQTG